MAYTKRVRTFRRILLRFLKRLAKNGCGDGGWCQCLLCRIMRIVQTEYYRTKPNFKSSFPLPGEEAANKTKLIYWRGGTIEFAMDCNEHIAAQPWWGIKAWIHGIKEKPWIYWLDYCGPPHLYLTKKAASKRAKELRNQYKCRTKVFKIEETGIGDIRNETNEKESH